MDKSELKVIILLLGMIISIGFGCIIGKYFFADNDKLHHASDLNIKSKQVILDEMVKEHELREKEKTAYFKYSNERINNYASDGKNEVVFSGFYCLYQHTFKLKGYDCNVNYKYYQYYDFREEFEKEYIPELKSKGYDVKIVEKDNEVKYVVSW